MQPEFELIDYLTNQEIVYLDATERAEEDLEAAGATKTGKVKVLPDNTKSFGPIFWHRPNWALPGKFSRAWSEEIEAPWRKGVGLVFRVGNWQRVVGVWKRSKAPELPEIVETDNPMYINPMDLVYRE
jgi:hypothetical protein